MPEAGGQHESGRAQHRVGPELHGVQEFVVDSAVNHVNARGAGGGAHPYSATRTEQVAAFNQLHPHQSCQQGVLKVGRVVDPGREHHHGGIVHVGRCRGTQCLQQFVWVVTHRPHFHGREQLGQGLRHYSPVGDHVTHAAGHAHIVFEHPPAALFIADEVYAGHMNAHAVWRDDAGRLPVEVARGGDQ